MTTTQTATVRRTEPPVTPATDAIRLEFHSLTGMVLPRVVCQACWLNVAAMLTGMINRDDILEVQHDCPHSVEPGLALLYALDGLPPEDHWSMRDPWNETR